MSFSEPPDARGSELAVLDASGRRVDRGDTAASGEPNEVRVSLEPIGEGGYVVAWTALSSVDGHTTRGSFAFAVGDAPLPALPDVGEAAPPPRALEIAGRALSFAGMAILLGGALFGLLLRGGPTPEEERREQLLLAAGGAVLVIGAVALLLEQGGRAPPRLAALLTLRGLGGVAVLGAAAALAERRVRIAALGAGLVAAATATAVSHAAASGAPAEIALDLAHALAASAWAGGVASFAVVVLPLSRGLASRDLGAVVRRFSVFAVAATGLVALTGLIQALVRLVLVEDLWETSYGLAVLAKIVLLAVALAFAAFNLLRWGPRLRAGLDEARTRAGLGLTVRGEIVPIALILAATGALTALVPPAQPSGAAFQETRHAGGLRLELLLASTSPGQNRYVLRVAEGLAPVTDAVRVAFRFTMIEHDMGEQELVAEQRAPGEYVAAGNATVMFGTWNIETIVRLPERADVRTAFTVPVSAPTGPGAVARVVSAPPYELIVYVSPPQPVAGAPLTLSVVVVDASGEPVTGKTLDVRLRGPSSQTASARESSPGHYEAPIAALDAGAWTATIALEGASGDYAFEVAR